jgi:hypothetical protein
MDRQNSLPDCESAGAELSRLRTDLDTAAVKDHRYPPAPISKTPPVLLVNRDIGSWGFPFLSTTFLFLALLMTCASLMPGAAIVEYFDQLSGMPIYAVGLFKHDPYWDSADLLPSDKVLKTLAVAHLLAFLSLISTLLVLLLKRVRPCALGKARPLAFYNIFWALFVSTEICLGAAWMGDWSLLSHVNAAGLDSTIQVVFSGGRIARETPVAFLLVAVASIFVGMEQKQERASAVEETKTQAEMNAHLGNSIPLTSVPYTANASSAQPLTIDVVENAKAREAAAERNTVRSSFASGAV